jgi:hypothetical protein
MRLSYFCNNQVCQDYWVFGLRSSSSILKKLRTQYFGNWICFCPQVSGRDSLCWVPEKELISITGQFQKLRIHSFLEYGRMDKVHIPCNSECYVPSSELFRMMFVLIKYSEVMHLMDILSA